MWCRRPAQVQLPIVGVQLLGVLANTALLFSDAEPLSLKMPPPAALAPLALFPATAALVRVAVAVGS